MKGVVECEDVQCGKPLILCTAVGVKQDMRETQERKESKEEPVN